MLVEEGGDRVALLLDSGSRTWRLIRFGRSGGTLGVNAYRLREGDLDRPGVVGLVVQAGEVTAMFEGREAPGDPSVPRIVVDSPYRVALGAAFAGAPSAAAAVAATFDDLRIRPLAAGS